MEWDDYYQALKSKNKNIQIADCLSSYKAETDAFYEDWKEAESKGKFSYGSDLDDNGNL